MPFKTVFQRYELKYLLTHEQKEKIMQNMSPHMTLDDYGRTTIRNLYYDTDNYLLARRSIEKPIYKEKLRIRSYSLATPDSTVFVEIKKKSESIVYKRRISLTEKGAMDWTKGKSKCDKKNQISSEIDYFLNLYETLHPVVFLSYEREAFFANDGSDFRVTLDENILCRQVDLSLCSAPYGDLILPSDMTLMEIKCSGGIPMWMTKVLSEEKIYKTSYSKYGTAYGNLIFPNLYKEVVYND